MRGTRRFSQAISEGSGISVLADVAEPDAARAAEADGAEGIVLRRRLSGVREATELPILWRVRGTFADAREVGADAAVLGVEGLEDEDGRLETLYGEALELGLDCAVEVHTEDELRLALERLDPDIFLLCPRREGGGDSLEHVLGLLGDVPAGKLAVADVSVRSRDDVAELERAGVDAVIVSAGEVVRLRLEEAPEV